METVLNNLPPQAFAHCLTGTWCTPGQAPALEGGKQTSQTEEAGITTVQSLLLDSTILYTPFPTSTSTTADSTNEEFREGYGLRYLSFYLPLVAFNFILFNATDDSLVLKESRKFFAAYKTATWIWFISLSGDLTFKSFSNAGSTYFVIPGVPGRPYIALLALLCAATLTHTKIKTVRF